MPLSVDGRIFLDPRDWRPLLSFVYDVVPGGPAALGLPCTAQWFDAKTRRPRGWEALSFHGLGGGLTIRRVLAHLAGTMTISIPPPREYPSDAPRYIEIDLDRHYAETETWESVVDRVVSCGRALGLLPATPHAVGVGNAILSYGEWSELDDPVAMFRRLVATPGVVLWRSSAGRRDHDGRRWPGGARLRVYVVWSGSDAALREHVVGLLEAAGVEAKDGYVEVWPHGGKPTRLPLGSGSCVLDEDGNPRFASATDRRLYRHLGADIEAFADAAHCPCTLPRVTWPINLCTNNSANAAANTECKENREGAAGAIEQRAAKRRDRLDAAPAASKKFSDPGPLRQRGQRGITSARFLCYLRTHRGLTLEQAMVPYERWLRRNDHVGDLSASNPGRGKTIDKMLRDMRADFERQDRKVEAGTLIPGKRSKAAKPKQRTFATPGVSAELMSRLPAHAATSCLSSADEHAIETTPSPWLRKRLRTFVGYLRAVQEVEGQGVGIAVTYVAVQAIAGTRRPSGRNSWDREDSPHYDDRATSPYRVLLRWAQKLGFLGEILVDGSPGTTATIYRAIMSVTPSKLR